MSAQFIFIDLTITIRLRISEYCILDLFLIYSLSFQGNGIVLKYFLQPNTLFGTTLEETEGAFRVPVHESDWFEEIEELGKG